MKCLLRSVCILLIIAMMFSIPVSAEEQNERSSAYFAVLKTYITRPSDTQIQIWFDVTGKDSMDKIGVNEIKLQRSVNNATWTTIKTYTPDDYPQMLEYNTVSCANYVPYTGSMYYYYRAYVTFYAKKGTGWGEMYLYTSPIRLD